MKKNIFVFFALFEFVKFFSILKTNANLIVSELPVSWFFASPLLVLPTLLCVFVIFFEEHSSTSFLFYIFAKVATIFGSIFCLVFTLSVAITKTRLGSNKLFEDLTKVMFYLIIDVIILTTLILIRRKEKKLLQISADHTEG
ncbi:MAG: hypothetical protein GX220_04890 [Treponema sp.]|nr:hypothetical protein [Treponema sp.]